MRARTLHSVKGHQVSEDNGSDPGIPPNAKISITPFDGDQMFQRWLVDRIFHRHEMRFERGTLEPVIGFLTGMDDQYYSVSTTGEWPVLSQVLPRHTVTRVSETGRSLHELDPRVQPLIKRFTTVIRRECEQILIPSRRIPPPPSARPSQQTV